VSGPEGTPNGVDRLAHLRQVAQAADNGSPWEWEHAYPQRVTRIGDVVLVAECFENPDMPSRFAEFIATFDPPVALALVEIAKAARALAESYGNPRDETYPDGTYALGGSFLSKQRFDTLRSALARLDSLKSAAPTVTATPSKGGACPAGNDGNVGAAE
jgi:hypothetical protein